MGLYYEDKGFLLFNDPADKALRNIPDEFVHCVVTSPPYYQLRDYGSAEQIGQESSPEEYVKNLVSTFREVRRVLRKDGTVWLNLGDTYAANRTYQVADNKHKDVGNSRGARVPQGLKPKDLMGIPWRVALALQADGWWLRSDIIWHKTNAMPEAVKDRPTLSHEYFFLFSKSQKYFYDHIAVQEDAKWERWGDQSVVKEQPGRAGWIRPNSKEGLQERKKRNRRSVWSTPTANYKGAHFAVFPESLISPAIQAATSERGGCAKCGCPRMRDKDAWKALCECECETVPCIILDPFLGSGTTAIVARKLGRDVIGIDIGSDYCQLAKDRWEYERKRIG